MYQLTSNKKSGAAAFKEGFVNCFLRALQGDHSGCDMPPVDIKTKVLF